MKHDEFPEKNHNRIETPFPENINEPHFKNFDPINDTYHDLKKMHFIENSNNINATTSELHIKTQDHQFDKERIRTNIA